ncbi:Protein of unknown function, partial [Gryllus bimaculatus]
EAQYKLSQAASYVSPSSSQNETVLFCILASLLCSSTMLGTNDYKTQFQEEELKGEVTNDTKCFLHCVLEYENIMSGNTINTTALNSVFDHHEDKYKSEMIAAANACLKEKDPADGCNTAYKFSLCVDDATRKIRKPANEPSAPVSLVESLY